ncbi:MAG: hypothetical protein ACE5FJ_07925 [Gemmatimonadales bacterium]
MRWVLFVGALTAFTGRLAGQGLPFHTETALTTAFEERGVRTFAAGQTRGDATVLASPIVLLPFAPHQRVTTKVVLPLLYKRLSTSPGSPYSNAGVGDVTVAAKWAFFVRNRRDGTTRFAMTGSLSLPTGSSSAEFADGSTAPRPMQLGKGVVSGGLMLVGTFVTGQWGLNVDVGHTRVAPDGPFRFGATTRYDVAIGFRLPSHIETIRTKTVQFYLEWNGSITSRSSQGGTSVPNSGGHVAYVSPGLQWVVLPQLLVEASVQIPVIQDHNGTQPDFGVRPALGGRLLFF